MDGLDSLFFTGVITSSDAATYNISVDPFGDKKNAVVQGIPLTEVWASTLGFKSCPQYPVGVTVLCMHITAERAYILGIIPEADLGNTKFFSRAALKTADGNFDKQNVQGYAEEGVKLITHNANRPTDIVEGEYALANEFGVLLGLFQEMANLKGSELAQIQCYVLDDLVRLVSHNFQHWTALGEFNIWHDGKAIQAEFGATHLSSESIGIPAVTAAGSKKVFVQQGNAKPDDSEDYYEITENSKIKAIERLKIFLGRLGDFMHLFLVRPDADAIRALDGQIQGNFDRGLADVHVSTDGRISMRSVSSIVLEKTNWIMVPHRVRVPEDPQGDEAEDITYEDKDPFEFDNDKKYQENPTLYFLQMRDCVAYLQDAYNYKNFLKQEKDFKLSKGPDTQEEPLAEIDQVDEKTKVKFADYKLRRSGIYMMDNGGVMIKDAWDSAIVLEGGNIYLQPAKDLVEQPMRNYVLKAGQFASVQAKKDVDISSTEGGFRTKTQKVQHLYSAEQGILLQSDAKEAQVPSPEAEAYDTFGGILFKSANAGVYTFGKQIFDRATDKALYHAKNLTIETPETANFKFLKDVRFLVTKTFHLEAESNITIVSKGTASFGGLSQTSLGQKGKILGIVPHPGSIGAVMDGTLDVESMANLNQTIGETIGQKTFMPFDTDKKFEDIKFRFLASDKYNLDAEADCLPMTIAQQTDEAFSFLNLKEWTEKEIEGTLPFPGKDKFDSFYAKSRLKNLKDSEKDVTSKDTAALENSANDIESASLNQYKILEK